MPYVIIAILSITIVLSVISFTTEEQEIADISHSVILLLSVINAVLLIVYYS